MLRGVINLDRLMNLMATPDNEVAIPSADKMLQKAWGMLSRLVVLYPLCRGQRQVEHGHTSHAGLADSSEYSCVASQD